MIKDKLLAIPGIMKAILTGFLVVMTIYIIYPISNYVLGMFETGTIMRTVAVLIFWLIIIFVTWFLMWIMVFKKGGN